MDTYGPFGYFGRIGYWSNRGMRIERRAQRSKSFTKTDTGSPAYRAQRKTRRKMAAASQRRNRKR